MLIYMYEVFFYKKETIKVNKEELKKFGYSNLHGHTDLDSNLRFYDAVETVPQVLDFASKNNYNAISFDGHESLQAFT